LFFPALIVWLDDAFDGSCSRPS